MLYMGRDGDRIKQTDAEPGQICHAVGLSRLFRRAAATEAKRGSRHVDAHPLFVGASAPRLAKPLTEQLF